MYIVKMIVNNETYIYGRYLNRDKANEVAIQVREQRNVETFVEEEK